MLGPGRLAPSRALPTLRLPAATAPALLIGRSRSCDLVLDEPTVSGVHAALMLFGGRWYVSDRGSTNGTCVNGRRIWGTVTVEPGDRLTFGLATFQLALPA